MAKVKWVDRVPTKPGRVRLIPVQGDPNLYDMTREDDPQVEGTPINAANLNAMQEDIGLSENMVLHVSNSGSDNTGEGTSSSPYATISKALRSVSKQLNGHTVTINVAAGVYAEDVEIVGFKGGSIVLSGDEGAAVSINTLRITETDFAQISRLAITLLGGGTNGAIYIRNANCSIWATIYTTAKISRGVVCSTGGNIYISSANISNKTDAIYAELSGVACVMNIYGNGNSNGLRAHSGSKIAYSLNEMKSTVSSATQSGGRIYSGAQVNVPNY